MPHLCNGNLVVSEHGLDTKLDKEYYSSALVFAGRRKPAVRPRIILESHAHIVTIQQVAYHSLHSCH